LTEQRPVPSPASPDGHDRLWDPQAIAEVLDRAAEPRLDQLYGNGIRFRLGNSPATELDLFPTSGIVRLSTPDLTLSLHHLEAPTLASEGVIFEASHHFLSVSPDGSAALHLTSPAKATESSSAFDHPTSEPNPPTYTTTASSGDPTALQEPSRSPSSTPQAEREQQEWVTLAGQLGTDVRYRTTRNGTLIASFPLAIRQEDGSTTWRKVKIFGERAAKLQAGSAPARGQYTEITGYFHRRDVANKDGTVRTVEEIYAVVVKPR
jgi:hypothetical protein